MPALCHTRTHAEDRGVVSQRSDWDADNLQIRLRNELSVGAWGRLSDDSFWKSGSMLRLPSNDGFCRIS
jgi:hypothetical protein